MSERDYSPATSFELAALLQSQLSDLLAMANTMLQEPSRQLKAGTWAQSEEREPTGNDIVMMALAKEAERQNAGGAPPGNLVTMIKAAMESLFEHARSRKH